MQKGKYIPHMGRRLRVPGLVPLSHTHCDASYTVKHINNSIIYGLVASLNICHTIVFSAK